MRILKAVLIILAMAISSQPVSSHDWAQVRIPVACIRDGKSHASEMTSQLIMGTPVQILEDDVEWIKIKAPDGYEGYVNISGLTRKSEKEMADWRLSDRVVVVSRPEVKVYGSRNSASARDVVSELVLSSIVEGRLSDDVRTEIKLPDGRCGYVDSDCLLPASVWAKRSLDMDSVVDTAYWLMGTPYLWGACSTKSVDCSGLVRVCYFDRGVLTLRDARQQIAIGRRIGPDDVDALERGDLLFFSNSPDGRISHVAIYDAGKRYIHSSGLVKTNMMLSDDPDFGKRYYRGASRIAGHEGSEGIMRMSAHPWYFKLQ